MSWLAAAPVEKPLKFKVLHALSLGIKSDNAGRAIRIRKALRNQAHIPPADRLTKIGEVAHKTEVELIECRGIQCLGIAQSHQLRPSVVTAWKLGTLAPLCATGYGLSRLKVVDKIIGGKQAPSAVGIDAHRAFVHPAQSG